MPARRKLDVICEDELAGILAQIKFEFGPYLRAIRLARGISVRQLAKAVDKTPTYISDIEKNNNKPPEKLLLDDIILNLGINEYFPNLKNTLYDLAARERNDVPADVKDYIMGNDILLKVIRTTKDRPDSQHLWLQILEKV